MKSFETGLKWLCKNGIDDNQIKVWNHEFSSSFSYKKPDSAISYPQKFPNIAGEIVIRIEKL